jgi:hypothetical protein
MTKQTRGRDPLGPLDAVTSLLATVLVVVFAIGGVAAIFTDGITFFDVNGPDICIEADGSVGASSDPDPVDREFFGLRDDVTTYPARTTVCDRSPVLADRALAGLSVIPSFAVFVGFLFLTRRTIRYARIHGLFSMSLARRIERLGWLLVTGLVGAASIEWLASGLLLHRLVPLESGARGSLSISVASVIGAVGVISMGRVMARAAFLQEDADATI